VNKVPNPVKMEYKGQTTVLVTVSVVVGMIFLAPGAEKSIGSITNSG